jgi:hypothetical protein
MRKNLRRRFAPTLRLLEAGIFAGIIQVIVVLGILVVAFIFLDADRFAPVAARNTGLSVSPNTLPLIGIDILTAVFLSLIRNRHVEITAARLREACWQMNKSKPDRVAIALLTQLILAAAGCAVLTMKMPPSLLLKMGTNIGGAGYGGAIWPAVMSIGIAIFGANAHAAALALFRSR